MKFYDRKKELNILRRISENKSCVVLLTGKRRVGKTSLLLKSFPNALYFYFPKNVRESLLVEDFRTELISKGKIDKFSKFTNLKELIEYVFSKLKNEAIIFDEFQRIIYLDGSLPSFIQKYIDLYSEKNHLKLYFAGSSVGMISKLFTETDSPLYKRFDLHIKLKPFEPKTVFEILNDFGIKDLEESFKIFFLFGGFPYYYKLMEKYQKFNVNNIINDLILDEFGPLRNEIIDTMIEEFGRIHPTYFCILNAIVFEKQTRSEMANFCHIEQTSMSKYLYDLGDLLGYVSEEKRATDNWVKSKKTRYVVNDNFTHFWFEFIYRNRMYMQSNQYMHVRKYINSNLNAFFGKMFEQFVRTIFYNKYPKVSRWWGVKPKTREDVEIDVVALNPEIKEIIFGESKWQDQVDAQKIAEELNEKTKYVDWHNKERKETLYIFAKSFKKKIKKIDGKDVKCVDLKQLTHLITR